MDKPRTEEEDERIGFADEPDERDSDLDSKLAKEPPADKARQEKSVLRSVWPRAVFFGALALIVIGMVIWRVLQF
jgi:hypothetical protein